MPTFVFDEVDAGIGGAAAIEVGRRLARLAESSQVIAVTHLAQVAAFANNHLSVVKASDGSVTASDVRRLEAPIARPRWPACCQECPTRMPPSRTPASCWAFGPSPLIG